MKIRIVDEQPCPRCGAYWGHPDKTLNWPNRIKVDDHWKCYNPECTVGFYDPETGWIEERPTKEEELLIAERVKKQLQGMTITVIDEFGNEEKVKL